MTDEDYAEHPTQFAAFVLAVALVGGAMLLIGSVCALPRRLWRRVSIPRCAICRAREYQRWVSVVDGRGVSAFRPVCGSCVSLPPAVQARKLDRAA